MWGELTRFILEGIYCALVITTNRVSSGLQQAALIPASIDPTMSNWKSMGVVIHKHNMHTYL